MTRPEIPDHSPPSTSLPCSVNAKETTKKFFTRREAEIPRGQTFNPTIQNWFDDKRLKIRRCERTKIFGYTVVVFLAREWVEGEGEGPKKCPEMGGGRCC